MHSGKDSRSWIWAASIDRAVAQHPGFMHIPRIPHKDIKEFPLVIIDCLDLDGMKQLPVVETVGVICWGFNLDMTNNYCTTGSAETWLPLPPGHLQLESKSPSSKFAKMMALLTLCTMSCTVLGISKFCETTL